MKCWSLRGWPDPMPAWSSGSAAWLPVSDDGELHSGCCM
jgi:hypothetical protein